jgi:hypothetical protein
MLIQDILPTLCDKGKWLSPPPGLQHSRNPDAKCFYVSGDDSSLNAHGAAPYLHTWDPKVNPSASPAPSTARRGQRDAAAESDTTSMTSSSSRDSTTSFSPPSAPSPAPSFVTANYHARNDSACAYLRQVAKTLTSICCVQETADLLRSFPPRRRSSRRVYLAPLAAQTFGPREELRPPLGSRRCLKHPDASTGARMLRASRPSVARRRRRTRWRWRLMCSFRLVDRGARRRP